MPSEPGTPTSYPAPSDKGVEDSFGDGRADFALKDHALDLLAVYFPSESEASDSTNETFATVKPAVVNAKAESTALPVRGDLRQTELAITQSVANADAFKTELAQLRDLATKLTTEFTRIETATRVVEQRSVAAASAQSMALSDLRQQLQQTELVIKQSAGSANAYKTELAQLRELATQLTTEFGQIETATRVVEQRSVAAATAQSIALTDLHEQLHQTELTIKQSAGSADAFRTELAQLRERGAELTAEYSQIQNATRVVEERSVRAASAQAMALSDLRELLHQTELAIEQSVGNADACRTEVAHLRELGVKLRAEYNQIENATCAIEERSVAAASAQSMALSDLREQLHQTELTIKQSAGDTDAYKTELAQLRDAVARLTGEYCRIEEATHTLEKRSAEALEIVNTIQTRVQPLAIVQDLSRQIDIRLADLNALADQVIRKAEALESQEAKINSVLERGNGVDEIVEAMEARIARLKRANQLIELSERITGRLEQLARSTSQLAPVATIDSKGEPDLVRPEKGPQTPPEPPRIHVEEVHAGCSPADGHARLRERDTLAENIHSAAAAELWAGVHVLWQNAARAGGKTSRLIWRHGDMIGGLAVIILAAFIVARSFGNAVELDSQRAPTDAQPVLVASTRILPEMMLTPAVPILPRTMLSSTAAAERTGGSPPQLPTDTRPLPQQQPSATPQPAVDAQSKQNQVRSSNFMGTLEIQSDPPGASVFINRERVGETPLQIADLRAGSHVIWVEREGYERWTAAVRMVAGTVTRVDVTLQPEQARPGISNER
jgi:hypothetical protein